MAYGDEFNPDEVFAYQLREFSVDVKINHKLVTKVLTKQCDTIIQVLEEEIIDIELLNSSEQEFIETLTTFILDRAKRFKGIALEIPNVTL
jgi:hypothetical protein